MTGEDRGLRVLLCAPDRAERDLVAAALAGRGVPVRLFDPARFPGAEALTLAGDGPRVSAVWSTVAGVVGTELPPMEPGERETCAAAAEMMVAGWLDGLDAYQLDPYWAQRRADNKPYQLRVAREVGLDVPATLVSNDAAAVRAFVAEHRPTGPIVAKMLVQPVGGGVVFTTEVDGDDLSGLDLCPMIFQARVPNAGDVRATIVGADVIAAVHHGSGGGPDWRRASYARDEAPAWSACDLPPYVSAALRRLAARLGLDYGAADLVRRPDGTHAFLELNATGSFAFLGAPVAARIADAVAAHLVNQGREHDRNR